MINDHENVITVLIKKIGCLKIIAAVITIWYYHTVMHPKDGDRMTSSVDPDYNVVRFGLKDPS